MARTLISPLLGLALGLTSAIVGCEKPARPTTTVPGECTDDAKICPDGTPVGRAGPSCEFAPCPGPNDGAAPAVDGTAPDGQTSPPVPTEGGDTG